MNSFLKKSNFLIKHANMIKGNIIKNTKFNFFSLNKDYKSPVTNLNFNYHIDGKKNINFNVNRLNNFYFSNKNEKDKESEKKEETVKKEVPTEENKSKPSEENPQNDPNDNKDENKDKDDKKKNKKDKSDSIFMEFINLEFIKNNYIIYSVIISGLVLYIFYSLKSNIHVKTIDMQTLNQLIASRDISNIEFFKDTEVNDVTAVFHKKSDSTEPTMVIPDIREFLRNMEVIQAQMGYQVQNFIPIKFINEKYEKSNSNELFYLAVVIGGAAGILYRKANLSHLKRMGRKGGDFKKSDRNPLNDKSSKFNFNNFFDFKNSNAKEYGAEEKINIKFADVAGMEQAKKEIVEFVDFLKNPEKYKVLGAKIPRGALLVGPPGTGKTLLAKAVAGEAGVPFFATSGSDFVEMFVGVGASRVRDLFKKAKDKAPSILFIDEIDAVGKKRGGKFGGHDERDNTLNQLLVEMDGFGTESNVIVLAATNRADILDAALLRPGRFDRQVEVALPDRKDRQEIVKIYLNKVKLDKSKNVDEYAMRLSTLTPGFSGADLSNLVNEAAIISARENKEFVDSDSFEKASERIIAGLETKRLISPKEKKTVAYHEAGHAVVGWFLENSNPLVKVTIIPRSKGSLGFAQYIPDDISLHTKEYLLETICVLLGGRMSEEHFFNQITSGASDDLQKVSAIANSIVTKYGMSDLGLRAYGSQYEEEYMAKPYSPQTEAVKFYFNYKEIDNEVKKIIDLCAVRTREMVKEHRILIEKLAEALLEKETVDIIDLIDVLGHRPFPINESLSEYLKEIETRKMEQKKRKEDEEELKKKTEEEELNKKLEMEKQPENIEEVKSSTTENENKESEVKKEEEKKNETI